MLPFAAVTTQSQTLPATADAPAAEDADARRADASAFLLLYDGADDSLSDEATLPDLDAEEVETPPADAQAEDDIAATDPAPGEDLTLPVVSVAPTVQPGSAGTPPDLTDLAVTIAAVAATPRDGSTALLRTKQTVTGPSGAEAPPTSTATTAPTLVARTASAPLATIIAPSAPDRTDRIRLDGVARAQTAPRAVEPGMAPPTAVQPQVSTAAGQPAMVVPPVDRVPDAVATTSPDPAPPSRDTVQQASSHLATAAPVSAPAPAAAPAPQAPIPPAELPSRFATLVDEVQLQARDTSSTAPLRTEIELAPAALGRIRVTVETGERGLHLAVVTDQPQTVEIVRRQLDILHRALVADGVVIDRVELGSTPRQSTGESSQGQSASTDGSGPRGDRPTPQNPGGTVNDTEGEAADAAASPGVPTPPLGARTRLDLRL